MLLAVAAPPGLAAPQTGDGWNVVETDSGPPLHEYEVVLQYAPDILQWVSNQLTQHHLDYITGLDFDEVRDSIRRWRGDDNWNHADTHRDRLYHALYGGLVGVTKNQLYLVYYFFHPRDYATPFESFLQRLVGISFSHENDFEGGMLVVDRSTQRVIHVMALAHDKFDERHVCTTAGRSGCWRPDQIDSTFVWVEPGGHGAHLVASQQSGQLDKKRDAFIRYVPVGGGDTPNGAPGPPIRAERLDEVEWDAVGPATTYRLLPLWTLFRGMFWPDSLLDRDTRLYSKAREPRRLKFRGYEEPRIGMYRAVYGRKGGKDKAHFPWGQDLDWHRFLDPVPALLNVEDTGPDSHAHAQIACDYVFNPYLQTLFEGRPPPADSLRFRAKRNLQESGYLFRRCAAP